MINCPKLVFDTFQFAGGYRVCIFIENTSEVKDCQAFFGDGDLWITYPTKEEALTAARKVGRVRTTND
jgi:hypothetical protein